MLDLVSASLSVLSSGLWMSRRQPYPLLCHWCIVGPQDGLMEGSRVRCPLQPWGLLETAPLLETQRISAHSAAGWLVSLNPWPSSNSSLRTLGYPQGTHFPSLRI